MPAVFYFDQQKVGNSPLYGYNLNLTNNDGSQGVHNPPFLFEFLDASVKALTALFDE